MPTASKKRGEGNDTAIEKTRPMNNHWNSMVIVNPTFTLFDFKWREKKWAFPFNNCLGRKTEMSNRIGKKNNNNNKITGEKSLLLQCIEHVTKPLYIMVAPTCFFFHHMFWTCHLPLVRFTVSRISDDFGYIRFHLVNSVNLLAI